MSEDPTMDDPYFQRLKDLRDQWLRGKFEVEKESVRLRRTIRWLIALAFALTAFNGGMIGWLIARH
jgi:hypothetical protein